jgi:hypothetical protein
MFISRCNINFFYSIITGIDPRAECLSIDGVQLSHIVLH